MPPKQIKAGLKRLSNIEELIDSGGEITVGRVGSVPCAASACDQSNCLAMLRRRGGESFPQLLERLDAAIGRAWEEGFFTDEINTPN